MKKTILASAAASIVFTAPAFAMDEEAVMKQLEAMQAQMQQMQAQVSDLKQELASAKERAASAEKRAALLNANMEPAAGGKPKPKPEPTGSDVKMTMAPAPKFETADGNFVFKVGGFAQVDAGIFDDDIRDQPNGTNIRRARFNMSGTIAKDWRYKIENDFSGNASTLTDVYLEYAGFKDVSLMVGQFKEPFGMETLTGDLFTSFIERSSTFAFSPDRKIGVQASTWGDSPVGNWTVTVGGFGAGAGTASADDEQRDVTGRLTWAPVATGTEVIHLGVAGSYRVPDAASSKAIRISSRPETSLPSSFSLDTGNITGVDHSALLGLEFAGVYGAFSLQGEYARQDIERRNTLADATYDGYYVEASYFLTGESRNYLANSGKFDRTKPKWPVSMSEGHWGAWQVMARYSDLDLNDGTMRFGEMRDTTFGLKWIPQANVMFSTNYIMSNTDGSSVTPNDDPRVLMFRAQFDF